jgi:hypothetical protein
MRIFFVIHWITLIKIFSYNFYDNIIAYEVLHGHVSFLFEKMNKFKIF